MYDLVLSQLIFMDSLQTNNLMDNINPYITAPEINACFQDNLMKKQIIVNLMQLWLSLFLIIQTKSMICGKMM